MAIVADLIMRAALDTAGVRQGAQEAARVIGTIGERARAALERRSLLPDMQAQGARAADDLVRGLRGAYERRVGQLREQLARGTVSPETFEAAAGVAAQRFNARLLAGMEELRRRRLLSPEVERKLQDQLERAGFASGRAGAAAMANAISQYRGQIGRVLEDSLRHGITASRATIVRELGNTMRDLGDQARSLGQGLTVGVTVPVVALGTAAIRAAADFERLELGLSAVAGGSEAAADQLDDLERIARLPGLGFREAIQGAIRLQAVGIEAEQSTRYLEGFGRIIALTGGGAKQLERVTYQLAQISSKGRLLQEDLRPILNAAPALGRVLREAFGTVDTEQIASLGLSVDALMDRVLDVAGRLPQVTGGLANAFENLNDAIYRTRVRLGRDLAPAVAVLVEHFESMLAAVRDMDPATVRLVASLGVVAAAGGPVLLVIGSLTTALGTLAIATTTTTAVLTGGITLALGALATAFIASRLEAVAATAEVKRFQASLVGQSAQELRSTRQELEFERQSIEQQIQQLENIASGRKAVTSGMFGSSLPGPEKAQINDLRIQLGGVQGQIEQVDEAMKNVVGTTGEVGGAAGAVDLGPLQQQAQSLLQLFEALKDRGEDTSAVAAEMARLRGELEGIAGEAEDVFGGTRAEALALANQLREATDPVTALQERSQVLLDTYRALHDAGRDTTAVLLEMGRLEERAARAARAQGEAFTATRAELEGIVNDLRQVRAPRLQLDRDDLAKQMEALERDLAKRGIQVGVRPAIDPVAMRELQLLLRTGVRAEVVPQVDAAQLEAAALRMGIPLENAALSVGRILNAGSEGASATLLEGARRAANELRESGFFGRTAGDPDADRPAPQRDEETRLSKERIQTFNEELQAAQEVVSSLGDLNQALGESFPLFGMFLDGLGSVMEGLNRMRVGREIGGVLGTFAQVSGGLTAFAGAVGFVTGLINREAQERRQQAEALARSNQELADFQLRLQGFEPGSGENLVAARNAVASVLMSLRDPLWGATLAIGGLADDIEVMEELLQGTGLTFEELAAISEELGINLLEDGRITVEELQLLQEYLNSASHALTRFTKTLDDQRTLMDARRDIFDQEVTPEVVIRGEYALLASLAPELVKAFGLDQVDFSVPEQVETVIRRIFEAIEAGTIPADLLGALPEGVRTLLEVILNMEGALDDMRESADTVTEAFENLANVPELFDLALRQRQAAFAGVGGPITAAPLTPGGTRPADTGGNLPGRTPGGVVFNVNVYNPSPGLDPRQFASDVKSLLERDPEVQLLVRRASGEEV